MDFLFDVTVIRIEPSMENEKSPPSPSPLQEAGEGSRTLNIQLGRLLRKRPYLCEKQNVMPYPKKRVTNSVPNVCLIMTRSVADWQSLPE
jgi:hypothetical protein